MGNLETELGDEEAESLRAEHYNATVTHLRHDTRHLIRMRVRLDDGAAENGPALHYEPGQYTTLGLGYWEPRVEGAQPEELNEKTARRVVKRAYSISCRMLDESDAVTAAGDEPEPEFYIALVLQADKPPALTPRLFNLRAGSRLHMGPRPKGAFTLGDLRPTDNVLFAATGTGEAPHNAMLSKLLAAGHQGGIASVSCVRYREDLAYTQTHDRLMEKHSNYRYVPLTTREKENRDPSHPGYSGVKYVQDLLDSADVAEQIGFELDSERTQVFLCGNPSMIGIPNRSTDPRRTLSGTSWSGRGARGSRLQSRRTEIAG